MRDNQWAAHQAARRGRCEKRAAPVHRAAALHPGECAAEGGNWIYEVKHDGYRLLAAPVRGEVRLFTRTWEGLDGEAAAWSRP